MKGMASPDVTCSRGSHASPTLGTSGPTGRGAGFRHERLGMRRACSIALVLFGSAGCITPATAPAPLASPESPATSLQQQPSASTQTLDPEKVYAQHLQRAARLGEECNRGAVDLEPFSKTAAYLLQFQAHPVRDAALVKLETCRKLVLDVTDYAMEESRPARMKAVAESMEEMTQQMLEELDLEGEVLSTHEGVSVTVHLEVPSKADSVFDDDVFATFCMFVQHFGVETLVLIDNGDRSECSRPVDESAIRASMLEGMNLSPPLDPPPAGERPVPID